MLTSSRLAPTSSAYSPRQGWIRKGRPSSMADTSSACSPAALTTVRARIDSEGVRTSSHSARASPPTSGIVGSMMTSRPAASRRNVRTSASVSTIPVDGDHNAARAATWGSRRWTKSRSTISRSSTPFARPRASSCSSAVASSPGPATISLPHLLCGTS